MKHINHLFSLFLAISLSVSAWGTDYTIGKDASTRSYTALPVRLNGAYGNKYTISQQIYLASELTAEGASEGDITAIKFYYDDAGNTTITRSLEVWIMETALSQFSMTTDNPGKLVCNASYKAGTKVFDGSVTMKKDDYTISFNQNEGKFHWNGSSNIILTVYDKTGAGAATNRHVIMATANPRFVHKISGTTPLTAWNIDDLYNTAADSYKSSSSEIEGHKWVNKITFTFEGAAVPPATPSGLTASNVGVTTASLAWNSVSDVTSYKLYHSTTADGVYSELASPATNSYNWSGLTANTTYYVKVAAVNGAGSSALSDPISFTTLAPHIHDGITFEPWFNPSAMPTSGDYYINSNMNFEAYATDVITLTGNLNLCLNGKTVNMEASRFVVPSGKTLTIYDNVGGGKLTSFVPSEVGAFEDYNSALIVVKSGGTLVLKEGAIENNYIPDEDGSSYAIYSNGTLIMSGAPVINSNDADIYLAVDGVVTLDGALSNSEPYSIKKYSGTTLTSGWSTHMSGENPRDYFVSASAARSVCLSGDEASLRTLLQLSETSLNSSISSHFNQLVDVNLTRSLTSEQYNTFCLPFALDDAQLQDYFGSSYDLEEFDSSELEGETLNLLFNKVDALEAGKPYLLKPSVDVVNPLFIGVTIGATSPVDQTSDTYISFHGTFAPTELTGGNKNLLFLGANDELFWPAATGNLKGFRAYFEVKAGAARSAARVLMSTGNRAPQGIQSVQDSAVSVQKVIRDGKLIIIRDGKEYNAQGNLIR